MENVQPVKDRDKLFLEKAHKTCVKSGKAYGFECPICSGYAIGMKSNVSGHIVASCSVCKMRVRK